MLPSAALIQPCRGAPPEPFGEGTQGCRQPSLNSVWRGKQSQQSGSGCPKIDSVMVSQIPRPSGQQQQSQQPPTDPLAVTMPLALESMNSLAVTAESCPMPSSSRATL